MKKTNPAIFLPRKSLCAILCLGILAWYPILRLGFIADDPFLLADHTIQENTWAQLKSDFGHTAAADANHAYYRPTHKMLIRLEYFCFGLHPAGYHLVNLVLHAGNSVLTAELVLALGFGAPAALVTGSLFAVNPIIAHDMIQATGAQPLAYMLVMASLLLLLRPGMVSLLSGLLIYGMALFCKESTVVTPFLFLLIGLVRSDLPWRRALIMLLMTIPYGALYVSHMGSVHTMICASIIPFVLKAFPKILLHYIVLFFFPWPLQSWPPIARLSPLWPGYLVGMLATGWLLEKTMGRKGLFCLGWVLIAMLPKIPALMGNNVMMDHWVYDAALGLLLPVTLVGLAWDARGSLWVQKALLVLLGMTLFGWGVLAHYTTDMRRTDELNYRWTLRYYSPDFALYRLGIILIRTGRPQEAATYLARLCVQSPRQADYENALALAYAHAGNRDQAITLWKALLRRVPGYAPAIENMALLRRL